MSKATVNPLARIVHSILIGLVQGAALGTILFFVEALLIHRALVDYYGVHVTLVFAVYLGFGCAVGVVVGLISGLVALLSGLRASAVSFSILAFGFFSMYVLREVPGALLRHLPAAEMISVVAAFFMFAGVAFLLGRALDRKHPRSYQSWKVAGVGTALSLAVLAVSLAWVPLRYHGFPQRSGAAADAPNIVLVVVDALRFDHLSCYGYPRETSPHIDRLAHDGTMFTDAYSHGNRTILAMPALFTSLYPSFHGAVGFQAQMAPLPDDRTTIAEICQQAGYATAGMMSNIYLKRPFNLTQGFDRIEEFNGVRYDLSVYRVLGFLGLVNRPQYSRGSAASATEVTDKALEWLARFPQDRPHFFFVHYMDVHHPYTPPEKYASMFSTSPEVDIIDAQQLFMKTVSLVRRQPPIPFNRNELQRLKNLYDGCIRYTDDEIGRLLDAVAAKSNGRETVVIFTSDHGDEFLEHGTLYHTNVLLQELIRVPLIVWRSDEQGAGAVDQLVRHIDVLPTVAELAEVEKPQAAMGHSLVPYLAGEDDVPAAEETVAEGDFCAAIVRDGFKIMRVDTSSVDMLFNLADDPMAKVNVADQYPNVLADMKARLDEYLARAEEVRSSERSVATDETLEQLKALGYVN